MTIEKESPFAKPLPSGRSREDARESDPARLRQEFRLQLQVWEMSGTSRVPAAGTEAILKDFIDEGWTVDDLFLEEVYRDSFGGPYDRDVVRRYRDARECERHDGELEIGG